MGAPGRVCLQVPGRVLLQALGRAPHPHHSALLLSRFKKSFATASVEATFISTLYDSFIYMFENEQHRSCFGKYLVSSFGSCFIYYEKQTCESSRRLLSYYSRESVDVQVLAR